MSGYFGVLQADEESSDGEGSDRDCQTNRSKQRGHNTKQPAAPAVNIPSYEDLSTTRLDEVTVLEAVYGDDFCRKDGAWGCPLLSVNVKPPDIEPPRIGCSLRLSMQLTKQYPYVAPNTELRDVKGLTREEQLELGNSLKDRAQELAKSGSVMMIELVQVAEDFLLNHNRDPTLSLLEQMQAREATKHAEERKLQEEMTLLMNSTSLTRVSFKDGDIVGNEMKSGEATKLAEEEMERLRNAFAKRKQNEPMPVAKRELTYGSGSNDDDAGFDDENDIDDDGYEGLAVPSSSRYKADFVELGGTPETITLPLSFCFFVCINIDDFLLA